VAGVRGIVPIYHDRTEAGVMLAEMLDQEFWSSGGGSVIDFATSDNARDIYHRSDRLFEGKIARYADDQRNNRNRNVWGGPGKNGIEVPICNPPSLASPADKGGRGMTSIESVIGACSGLIDGLATNQQLVTTNPSGHPILKPEEANPSADHRKWNERPSLGGVIATCAGSL
jgi:hypothetical protein